MTKTFKVAKELYRFGTSELDSENKLLRLSISSDTPYFRQTWDGDEYWEVLDHSPQGMDMSRLQAGTSLLYNHDRNVLLGRNMGYECDGHKCYVDSKISMAPDVESFRIKIEEDILKASSVGYEVLSVEQVGEKDGVPVIKCRWMPYEASLVTIEADTTVGVGRHHKRDFNKDAGPKEISIGENIPLDVTRENENNDSQKRDASQKGKKAMPEPIDAPEIDVVAERADSVKAERARVKKINDYVGALKNEQWKTAAAEIALKAIENGDDFDAFRTAALDSFDGVQKVKLDAGAADIGMTDKDVKRFSFLGAIRQMAIKGRLEGYEKEVCQDAQKKMKRELKDLRSFVIPEEVSRNQNEEIALYMFRQMMARSMTRAQNVGTATAGGFTVENQFGPLIELLRNRTVLGRLGITILDGLVGDFVMPVQTGGATAYWVSETGTITDSEATFGQKAMVPHRLGCSIPFTMQFIAQTSLSADAFIRNEMDIVLALKKDLAGLLGTGLGGEPLGVANTTGINATVTYSGAADWGDIVEHETGISVDNADIGTMGFVIDAATRGKWKTKLKDSVAGAGYLLDADMTTNGYRVEMSNQVSAAHQSFFGVWSQLMLGMWAGREITVDNITLAKSGQHQIIMNEFCDFLVRQPLAFNISTDSAAQ